MTRVNCVVEGQTEETFVKDCLAPLLGSNGIFVSARCVETGRRHGRIFRGGLLGYQKAKNDILAWLQQDASAYVTTMFDYYRLPNDFPGLPQSVAVPHPIQKAQIVQRALAADINSPRFLPYIQMHEFEGILFSDTEAMEGVLSSVAKNKQSLSLSHIRGQFETPEHINCGEDTAPSKRLLSIYQGYDKVLHGSLIASRIGLDNIRRQCRHFDGWITQILALSGK